MALKNKTKVKLIILIFIILLILLFTWFNKKGNNQNNTNNETGYEKNENLFPFDNENNNSKNQNQNWESGQSNNQQNSNNNKTQNQTKEESEIITKPKKKEPELRQVSKIPIAGIYLEHLSKEELHKMNQKKEYSLAGQVWTFDDYVSEIRYVAQSNGYIYSTFTNSDKINLISNTTIPKVYRADFWDKNNLIIQYADRSEKLPIIKTYSIKLSKKSNLEKEIEAKILGKDLDEIQNEEDKMMTFNGVPFPTNIDNYSLLKKDKKIFYLKKKGETETVGILTDTFNNDPWEIYSSPLNEWNLFWANRYNIFMITKPTYNNFSLSFRLGIADKIEEKLAQPLKAANGLPNYKFDKILYSAKDYQNKFHLYIYNIKEKKIKQIKKIATLTDKCVWSKNNIHIFCAVPNNGIDPHEPDAWYRGYRDFFDSIYRINSETLETELVFNGYQFSDDFDIKNLQLDDFERHIYFIDWKTNYGWVYKLPELKDAYDLTKDKGQDESFDFNTFKNQDKKLGGGKLCPSNLILSENLKTGDRNGKYSKWAKKKITEVKILQEHMNRLGFGAGPVDGILGPKSDAAIKKMQKYLGTKQDGMVGPKTRKLLNNSCE